MRGAPSCWRRLKGQDKSKMQGGGREVKQEEVGGQWEATVDAQVTICTRLQSNLTPSLRGQGAAGTQAALARRGVRIFKDVTRV